MKFFTLVLITILPLHMSAQTLFGTGGGSITGTQNQFDFSIGEPITADLSAQGNIVNIGFQQPYYDFFTSVSGSFKTDYMLFPNPFTTGFRFEAQNEIESWNLTDAGGREVFHSPASGTTFEFKSGQLPPGLYHLRVRLSNGKNISSKIIHQ